MREFIVSSKLKWSGHPFFSARLNSVLQEGIRFVLLIVMNSPFTGLTGDRPVKLEEYQLGLMNLTVQ